MTWAANVAVSSPFNPQAGFPQNQKIGDYITIVSDDTGGNVAYAATFNVNPKPSAGTNKMSITCAYRHRAEPHLRRRPQLRPHLRRHRQLTNANSNGNAHGYSDSYARNSNSNS